MATLPKFSLPQFINGIVREAAVDEIASPEQSVQEAVNLNFNRIGAIELRKGLTILGSQVEAGAPVLGMHNFINNAGTIYRLLIKIDNDVYAWNGSTWSSVRSGLTASSKARFASFVDYTFMVNGNGNQALQTWAGTGSFGTTNAASLPAGDFIENYRSRIWVANNATDKLYYSNVVTTSNTITGGTSFLQISPQDGENITALKRYSRALLVFKQNHIYRVFSINATDPDPSILRGTYSQESVVETKNGIYYHHPTGFYQFVFDGVQREISRPIIDIVEAIPRSYYANVNGWEEGDNVYWNIGDITLGGVNFTNVVVRYTISTETWTTRSYANELRSASIYDSGTSLIRVVGDDTGKVLQFDTGLTDDGTPIFYSLATHWLYFTSPKSLRKTISEIATLHENAQGGNIAYQIDTDNPNKWSPAGTIANDLRQIYTMDAKNFLRIRFRLQGNSIGSPFIWRGIEILKSYTEGEIKK